VGLFSRRKDPDRELAAAIAKRGVRARGTIGSLTTDGERHVFEITFEVAATAERRTVTISQRMAPQALVGLEPGEPVDISYDEADPEVAMVWGSPKYTTTETGEVVRRVDLAGGERG
jgi:hypothetical protein